MIVANHFLVFALFSERDDFDIHLNLISNQLSTASCSALVTPLFNLSPKKQSINGLIPKLWESV